MERIVVTLSHTKCNSFNNKYSKCRRLHIQHPLQIHLKSITLNGDDYYPALEIGSRMYFMSKTAGLCVHNSQMEL